MGALQIWKELLDASKDRVLEAQGGWERPGLGLVGLVGFKSFSKRLRNSRRPHVIWTLGPNSFNSKYLEPVGLGLWCKVQGKA